MATRACDWCGKGYEARTARSRYCSAACRKAAQRERDRCAAWEPLDVPCPGETRPELTEDDIAGAVVQLDGCISTLEAGARFGPMRVRPMCGRLAESLRESLEREGF